MQNKLHKTQLIFRHPILIRTYQCNRPIEVIYRRLKTLQCSVKLFMMLQLLPVHQIIRKLGIFAKSYYAIGEVESALSVLFSPDGQEVIGGKKNRLKSFVEIFPDGKSNNFCLVIMHHAFANIFLMKHLILALSFCSKFLIFYDLVGEAFEFHIKIKVCFNSLNFLYFYKFVILLLIKCLRLSHSTK